MMFFNSTCISVGEGEFDINGAAMGPFLMQTATGSASGESVGRLCFDAGYSLVA
jgi:hypothetical protein